jgi:hypothetical protein
VIGVVEFRDVLDQESWLIVTDRLMIWEVQPFVELRPMQEVVEVPSRQITAMSPVLRTIFHGRAGTVRARSCLTGGMRLLRKSFDTQVSSASLN